MKKLCIAVIVLSFLGFGPLRVFFHSETGSEGEEAKTIPILEKLKDSSEKEGKAETFLIMENSSENDSTSSKPGLLLKYDTANKKLEFGSIFVPNTALEGENGGFDDLKKVVKETYQVHIDYCFLFETSGIARVIDLAVPNGIKINTDYDGHLDGEPQKLTGEDFVLFLDQLKMNPAAANELSPMFLALKEELMKEISTEKILSLAPQIFNESLQSVNTDIGKGKLMELGLTVMMNPVTSIEQIEMVTANPQSDTEKVNKMVEDNGDVPVLY